jgi:hypothetical protein
MKTPLYTGASFYVHVHFSSQFFRQSISGNKEDCRLMREDVNGHPDAYYKQH